MFAGQELHSQSTLKAICIFMYISVRKYLLQRRSKLLSGGVSGAVEWGGAGGGGGGRGEGEGEAE